MQTQISSEQFKHQLIAFIEAEVALVDEQVRPDTDLVQSGLVDSLGVILVSDWIQEQLAISIDPVDVVLENFRTVEAMAAYARSRGAIATT